ncbi:DUF1425 domain-containing protein, partial [Pantoea agglomerans]|nr:DUF1425 domain-containing protein [Pantoea agglomerans]
ENDGLKRATSVLYNQRETPVVVHYRYYWYDDKGLEITPQESLPAHIQYFYEVCPWC